MVLDRISSLWLWEQLMNSLFCTLVRPCATDMMNRKQGKQQLYQLNSIDSMQLNCPEYSVMTLYMSRTHISKRNWLARPLLRNLGFKANPILTIMLTSAWSRSTSFSFRKYNCESLMDFLLQSDQLCVDQKGQKHLFYDLQSQASRFQDCQDCVFVWD